VLRYFTVKALVQKFGKYIYLVKIHNLKLIAHYHFGKIKRKKLKNLNDRPFN
jgi:hypothetical protein